MKVIIAGSRSIVDYTTVCMAIRSSGFDITEVVSGGATGVDRLGERWAKEHLIPVREFLADWGRFGVSAGPIRNDAMADYGEALIAVPGPNSRGTWDMIRKAWRRGIPVYIHEVTE